jgi:hypothetical protein
MKLKTVTIEGKTYAVVDDNGQPVYTHNDGRDLPFDAPGTMARIGGLNKEAQTHREAFEAAQATLKRFEGIEDPDAARQALTTVGNLKAGDLKTAAEVEAIKEAARKAAETQQADIGRQSAAKIDELTKERDTFRDGLYAEKVGGAFSRSKFITDKSTVPPDMMQAMFGKHFKIEDGKIVPYGPDGNKIYSTVKGGEVADFEEGLEYLVNSYPNKGNILKGAGHNGGSGAPGQGGQQGGKAGDKPTMTRQAFDGMSKAAAVKSHTIVDGGP